MAKAGPFNQKLIAALIQTGVITDPKMVERVIIDIRGGRPPVVHVKQFGDADGLADVILALAADLHLFDTASSGVPLAPDTGDIDAETLIATHKRMRGTT